AVPFALGYLSAPWFHARLLEPVPLFGFQLFFAVAMSITAIPVLGRIFMELGLSHTRTAALTIGAAAIGDVSGWVILGAISLLGKGAFSWGWGVRAARRLDRVRAVRPPRRPRAAPAGDRAASRPPRRDAARLRALHRDPALRVGRDHQKPRRLRDHRPLRF